ncbi:hypothetical protein AB0J52_13020 [Spirillospora sp. NPDC049652]
MTQVDAHVMQGHKIHAVRVIRGAFDEPRPGLCECLDVVVERFADLGQRFTRSPTAPLDLEALTAKIQALPQKPTAIEALWDGDTDGWFVYLVAVTLALRAEHRLALVLHGTDMRLLTGRSGSSGFAK